jgi:hypothetical protein
MYDDNVQDFSKALTSTNTAAIPTYLPKKVTAIANYRNPLRAEMPRKSQEMGDEFKIVRADGGTADWMADGTTPTDRTGNPVDYGFAFKRVGARLIASDFRLAKSGRRSPGIDLWVSEIKRKIVDIRNVEDLAYHIGAAATGQNDPQGFKYLCPDANIVLQGAVQAGNALSLTKIDEAMDTPYSTAPEFALCNLAVRRMWNALLQANQRFIDYQPTQKAGYTLMFYNGAWVYPSTNMSVTQNFTGTCEGDETGGTTGSIYFGNFDDFYVGILAKHDMVVKPTDLGNTIWTAADIECWETVVADNDYNLSKLIGIGPF